MDGWDWSHRVIKCHFRFMLNNEFLFEVIDTDRRILTVLETNSIYELQPFFRQGWITRELEHSFFGTFIEISVTACYATLIWHSRSQ